jgi:hypothetical protein
MIRSFIFVLCTQCYYGEQIKKDVMGRTYSMCTGEMHIYISV